MTGRQRVALILLASALILGLVFSGCALWELSSLDRGGVSGDDDTSAVTSAPTPPPTPEPTPENYVIMGATYLPDAETVDLRGIAREEAASAADALTHFTGVKTLLLGSEGDCALTWDEIALLHSACPEAVIDYGFTLYGIAANLSDTALNLSHISVSDGGAAVKQAMGCMTALTYLDMDSCGVSNEDMAAIRDAFPKVKVVWRIWFGDLYSVRTDVERILASTPGYAGMLVHDNVMPLQYCTDVKYLDLGHNNKMDTIEFIRSMPKLEVGIFAISSVEDFSPLADCPELEYLEIQTAQLHDLTPLKELHKLKHLNICYSFDLCDLSPIYGLTQLERLWIGVYDPIPPEQVAMMQSLAPQCEINTTTLDPTYEGWRIIENHVTGINAYAPRYELLMQQFGYQMDDYSYWWNDPLY